MRILGKSELTLSSLAYRYKIRNVKSNKSLAKNDIAARPTRRRYGAYIVPGEDVFAPGTGRKTGSSCHRKMKGVFRRH